MKRIISFLEKIPLFLFLIPLFLVIHIEKEFHGLIEYSFVYLQIIELFIAPILILILTRLLFSNWNKALIATIPFLILFYFFADLKDTLTDKFPDSFFNSYKFLLPIALVICFLIYFLVRKKQIPTRKIFLYTNLSFLLFIAADLIAIGLSRKNTTKTIDIRTALPQPCRDCVKPDIYYIVFDSYASSERLKTEFGFDNSRIDSFLAQKKFYQVRHATSNYNFTPYSIGSTLNADYLQGIDPERKVYLRDYLPYLKLIRENTLVDDLKLEGYDIVNHSIFNFKDYPSTIPPYDLWDMSVLYERHNIFYKVDMEIGWMWRSRIYKDDTAYLPEAYIRARDRHDSLTIVSLKQTLNTPNSNPRFVYTHIEIPHAPFSFDSLGNRFRVPVVLSPEKDKADYIGQLIYSNTKLMDLVNTVFEKAKRPFIIVLQGDHGFRFFDYEKRDMEFDNLSAFYFYNQDYRLLYDSMSNINTYNVIRNTFFKANLPLKKDSTVFLPY